MFSGSTFVVSKSKKHICSSIYKEAWRDRLYEALATLAHKKGEKVLNPDTDPESPGQGNINRVKMKNIIHALKTGFNRIADLSAFLHGPIPSFEDICWFMRNDCQAEACCCCESCCC
jgi:hypothetical protein